MTIFFIFVIVICTVCTLLFNSVNAKLGRFEASQRELDFQLKKQFEILQQKEVERKEVEQKESEQEESEQEAVTELEKTIASAREAYKDRLSVYNESIGRFPGKIIAQLFGFKAIVGDDENEG